MKQVESPAPRRSKISEEDIRRLYVDGGLSLKRTADVLGVHFTAVHKRMIDLGIPRRASGSGKSPELVPQKTELSIDMIRHLYEVERWSAPRIGKLCGLTGQAILNRLRKADAAVRPGNRRPAGVTDDLLRQFYVEERLSTRRVAHLLGISATSVRRYLIAAGIPLRAQYESQRVRRKRDQEGRPGRAAATVPRP